MLISTLQATVSQPFQWLRHIVRHRTLDVDAFVGYRVAKSEFGSMQHQADGVCVCPEETILPAVSVGRVTDDRVIDTIQMPTNLMEPTGPG